MMFLGSKGCCHDLDDISYTLQYLLSGCCLLNYSIPFELKVWLRLTASGSILAGIRRPKKAFVNTEIHRNDVNKTQNVSITFERDNISGYSLFAGERFYA